MSIARALMLVTVGALLLAVPARALAIGGPPEPRIPLDQPHPEVYKGMEVLDKRGAQLPLDLRFLDQDGQAVSLADYARGDLPLVLVMAYYTCPGLCTAVINDMLARIKALPFTIGQEFRVVVVSFDERDDVAVASGKRAAYLESLGARGLQPRTFDFLVMGADKGAARRLADTIGFQYKWDDLGKIYGHPGVIFVVEPQGKLSVAIPTMNESRDLRMALVQAGEGKVGSWFDQAFARCYHWDPKSHGYKLLAFQIFKWAGLVIVLGLVCLFFFMWRLERRRRRTSSSPSPGDAHAVRT